MLSLIVAIADENVIGKDNKLIWHISEDLKRFKAITSGHKMLMGRKTFESLPGVLPNREHIIITRNKDFSVDSERVSVIHDLDSFINEYKSSDEEVFVIGGAEIYKELLPYCNKLYLTRIHNSFEGDTFFPEVNLDDYTISFESEKITDEKSNLTYQFIDLLKK
ncbi:MAG: dihydrofolate reductase [Clostridium sp.]|nr:dihydrofolate reductase [Clostridium sp.]